MRIRLTVVAGLCCSVLLAGCAREPEEKVLRAKQMLDSASGAGAAVYCESRYSRAKTLLDSAASIITTQRKAPAFLRSYSAAEHLLSESERVAREALDSLPAARELYRTETTDLVERAHGVVVETQVAATAAIRAGKKAEAIAGEVKDMEEMLAAAAAALSNDDLIRAHSLATSVMDKAANYRSLVEMLPTPAARFSGGAVKKTTSKKK